MGFELTVSLHILGTAEWALSSRIACTLQALLNGPLSLRTLCAFQRAWNRRILSTGTTHWALSPLVFELTDSLYTPCTTLLALGLAIVRTHHAILLWL